MVFISPPPGCNASWLKIKRSRRLPCVFMGRHRDRLAEGTIPVFPVFPALNRLNIMKLSNPHTAILSAVIYNAIIIVILIPLALRGVKFKAQGASAILRRNILIYGVGGIIAPFILIKLIDILLTALGVH